MYVLGSVLWLVAYGVMIGCYMDHFKVHMNCLVFCHSEGVELIHMISYSLLFILEVFSFC